MLEELRYALFAFFGNGISHYFICENDKIEFIYDDITLMGFEEKILVFYESNKMGVLRKSTYLNKENTMKVFYKVSSAISYLEYLAKVIVDNKYELYHYFLFKLRAMHFNYKSMSFSIVSDNTAIRCDISRLDLNGNRLQYNFIFISKNDSSCTLSFYPEQPLWNEGKICPESDVDKILDYIKTLSVYNYDEIPLKEK